MSEPGSDPEREIEDLQSEQISSALKYILKGALNPAGARYFFIELFKIAQMKGEFLKDGILNFQEIDALKKRFDSIEKLLDTLRHGRRSPSSSLKKEDVFDREMNRLLVEVIYDLTRRDLSYNEALLILKEQYEVAVFKGKCHDEWSGALDNKNRDEVLDKLYVFEQHIKNIKYKKKLHAPSPVQESPPAKEPEEPQKIERPNYVKEYVSVRPHEIKSPGFQTRGLLQRKKTEIKEDIPFRKKFEEEQETSSGVSDRSYRWGKFIEDASTSVLGGKEVPLEEDQLGILNKLPVIKSISLSSERDYDEKKKNSIIPKLLNEFKEAREKRRFKKEQLLKEDGRSKKEQLLKKDGPSKEQEVSIFLENQDIKQTRVFIEKREIAREGTVEKYRASTTPKHTGRVSILDVKVTDKIQKRDNPYKKFTGEENYWRELAFDSFKKSCEIKHPLTPAGVSLSNGLFPDLWRDFSYLNMRKNLRIKLTFNESLFRRLSGTYTIDMK